MTFIVDHDSDALSAGAAIERMLENDPVPGDPTLVPLFRMANSMDEISYELSKRRLKECLSAVGLEKLVSGCHCLRIGGATAYANPKGRAISSRIHGTVALRRKVFVHARLQGNAGKGRVERGQGEGGRLSGETRACRPIRATLEVELSSRRIAISYRSVSGS